MESPTWPVLTYSDPVRLGRSSSPNGWFKIAFPAPLSGLAIQSKERPRPVLAFLQTHQKTPTLTRHHSFWSRVTWSFDRSSALRNRPLNRPRRCQPQTGTSLSMMLPISECSLAAARWATGCPHKLHLQNSPNKQACVKEFSTILVHVHMFVRHVVAYGNPPDGRLDMAALYPTS